MDNNNGPAAAGTAPGQPPPTPPPQLSLEKSASAEDLSEYTDADESVSSAPTEFLAEFLSALMLKDYEAALKYCKLILQYEPDNAAAKEFYPLIVEKIQLMEADSSNGNSGDDDNGNQTGLGSGSAASSNSNSSNSSSSSNLHSEEEGRASAGSDSDATTASYSSLEDDDAAAAADRENGNSSANQAPHSAPTLGPPPPFQGTSSDSESPTEPISQQQQVLMVQQLRARVTPARSS